MNQVIHFVSTVHRHGTYKLKLTNLGTTKAKNAKDKSIRHYVSNQKKELIPHTTLETRKVK